MAAPRARQGGRLRTPWIAILVLVGVAGCQCGEQPAEVTVAPHYAGWEAVVDAVARGDRRDAAERSRLMTEGEPSLWSGPGAEDANARVGAGVGFIAMAEDSEELADGLASAALGCGDCHAAAGATHELERPALAHPTAARWVAWGLVWHDPRIPASEDERLQPLIQQWSEPVPKDTDGVDPQVAQAARWFAACARCHSESG